VEFLPLRSKSDGIDLSEVKRLNEPEAVSARPKKRLAAEDFVRTMLNGVLSD